MAAVLTPQMRRRRLGAWLLLLFTAGWGLSMPAIQFYQASVMGYGSGFGNRGQIPGAVMQKAGVGSDLKAAVAATVVKGSDGSLFQEIFRLAFSVAMLGGIILFWYFVMSNLGSL